MALSGPSPSFIDYFAMSREGSGGPGVSSKAGVPKNTAIEHDGLTSATFIKLLWLDHDQSKVFDITSEAYVTRDHVEGDGDLIEDILGEFKVKIDTNKPNTELLLLQQ
jgi:hypothetical protein